MRIGRFLGWLRELEAIERPLKAILTYLMVIVATRLELQKL